MKRLFSTLCRALQTTSKLTPDTIRVVPDARNNVFFSADSNDEDIVIPSPRRFALSHPRNNTGAQNPRITGSAVMLHSNHPRQP